MSRAKRPVHSTLRSLNQGLPTLKRKATTCLSSIGHQSQLTSKRAASSSSADSNFPGHQQLWGVEDGRYTNDYQWVERSESSMPTYRALNEEGELEDPNYTEYLEKDDLLKMYKCMVKVNVCDNIMYDSQRTGRISFYMTNYVEEATQIGSAAALSLDDVVFPQYRELGVFMWRGYTLQQVADTNFSNFRAHGRGVQMPVHYGDRALNIQTVSSPLATQIPQAAGAGYALKQDAQAGGKDAVAIVYFGEGAASEGDAFVALNFAATLETRTIFFVRNNGFAISTPVRDQYRGDGIAARGPALGIRTIRVDGNDILAVHKATKEAKEYSIANNKPVLIECMTYRGGHHSTSDDATRYRKKETIDYWMNYDNPIARLRKYLERKDWWTDEEDEEFRNDIKTQVLDALRDAETQPRPAIKHLFSDIYSDEPWHLAEQKTEMLDHVAKYPDDYELDRWEPS